MCDHCRRLIATGDLDAKELTPARADGAVQHWCGHCVTRAVRLLFEDDSRSVGRQAREVSVRRPPSVLETEIVDLSNARTSIVAPADEHLVSDRTPWRMPWDGKTSRRRT